MGFPSAAAVLRGVLSPARTLPTMPWSSRRPGALRQRVSTLGVLACGLWLFGTGEAGLVKARPGNNPLHLPAHGLAANNRLAIGGAASRGSAPALPRWVFRSPQHGS